MKIPFDRFHVPDNAELADALVRTTHLGIGAHQDDLELFSYHGIITCFEKEDLWYGGITVTDGAGSARTGPYARFSDEEMKQIRADEQDKAADIGKYAFQAQLRFTSSQVRDTASAPALVEQLEEILMATRPEVVYLHNPADKHDTHIAVLMRSLQAIRNLPEAMRPQTVFGCEVWRDLDWLDDRKKVALPVDQNPELARELIDVFDSQVTGGKNYTTAAIGRRHANATYFDPYSVDQHTAITFAVDLTPLIHEDDLNLADFTVSLVQSLKDDVNARIRKFS